MSVWNSLFGNTSPNDVTNDLIEQRAREFSSSNPGSYVTVYDHAGLTHDQIQALNKGWSDGQNN